MPVGQDLPPAPPAQSEGCRWFLAPPEGGARAGAGTRRPGWGGPAVGRVWPRARRRWGGVTPAALGARGPMCGDKQDLDLGLKGWSAGGL